MVRDLLSLVFVSLWGAAGWVAGTFFHQVRQIQLAKKDLGKTSLESTRMVTLLIFFVLVVAASEIGSRGAVPPIAKTGAIVVCVLCCVLGFSRPWK